jgi:hypothetical protein
MPSPNLSTFRNTHLTALQTKLQSLDLTNPVDTDLIINGALLGAWNKANLFMAAPAAPEVSNLAALSTADLNAFLADPGNLQKFTTMVNNTLVTTALSAAESTTAAWSVIAQSSATMTAIAASSTAMNLVASSSNAMAAMAASNTAMTALAASSVAMPILAASSIAMTAIVGSSVAASAVAASNTAMTAIAASSVALPLVRTSPTMMTAMYSSGTARTAMCNSPLRIVVTKSDGTGWNYDKAIHVGSGILVGTNGIYGPPNFGIRLDGGGLDWSPNSSTSWTYPTRYNTRLGVDWYYNGSTVAYIPC